MKKTDLEEFKLTELFCADQFEQNLKSFQYKQLPKFDNILREIPCKQGIADFICYKNTLFLKQNYAQIVSLTNSLGKTFIPVISTLLNNEAQDIQGLSRLTGYDEKRLIKILKVLNKSKIVKTNKCGLNSLYTKWQKFDIELWAFELKLKNWKRAIYQAAQYQSFTDKVFTVFPINKKELILKNLESFQKLGIGCIIQDYKQNKIEVLNYPDSSELKYNSPYLFTLTEAIIMKQEVC